MDFVFNGLLGSGKTLSAVAFGLGLAVANRMALFSNIAIHHPAYRPLLSIEHFASITHAVIVMDEAHRNLDSRLWSQNKAISDAILYNRKRMRHVIYTTPVIGNLDKRLRDVVPVLVVCVRPPGQSAIHLTWCDLQRASLNGSLPIVRKQTIGDPSIYYGLYSTDEEAAILPLHTPATASATAGGTPRGAAAVARSEIPVPRRALVKGVPMA